MKNKQDKKKSLAAIQIALMSLITILIFCTDVWCAPIVADHTATDITQIPEAAIVSAKAQLHIAYGHTSHGSQLTTGMSSLVGFMNDLGYPTNLYAYNTGGVNGALDLRNEPFSGASDLGNPDRVAWAAATRNYLAANPIVRRRYSVQPCHLITM